MKFAQTLDVLVPNSFIFIRFIRIVRYVINPAVCLAVIGAWSALVDVRLLNYVLLTLTGTSSNVDQALNLKQLRLRKRTSTSVLEPVKR